MMKASATALGGLRRSEGLRTFAYPDPASALAKATRNMKLARWGYLPASQVLATLPANLRGLDGAPWTVGYGQTRGITPDSQMTAEQAEQDLQSKIGHYEALVMRACTLQPTQGQFDALVQLAWNVEAAVSPSSSIIKAHNRADWTAAARAFELYCKAKGQVDAGLLARRKREAAEYLAASPAAAAQGSFAGLSAQAVDAESPLTASKINRASVAAGATAALTGASQVLDAVNAVKDGAASLGTWLVPVACLAIVLACAYVVWERIDMRRRGIV